MFGSLFRKRRVVDGSEIHEPTLLALGLTASGFLLLLFVLALVIFAAASFGVGWGLFAAVLGLLAALVLWPRLQRRVFPTPQPLLSEHNLLTGRQRWLRRLRGVGTKLFAVGLAAWLGLIAWSKLAPGGPMPAPKAELDSIRVVTWNILRGQERGPFWHKNNWPARKQAVAESLRQAQPDLVLFQEARAGQLDFLDEILSEPRPSGSGHGAPRPEGEGLGVRGSEYCRVGVGRDDGKSGGEHCAIYFKVGRFQELDGGTFWLEEPTDQPRGPGWNVKRICTWVRLRDQVSGRTLRVYNTHQYLTAGSQLPAARITLDHIKAGDPSDAVVLAGDFNATPEAPSRRVFADAGLSETAALAGKLGKRTYHFYGLPLRRLDGILVGPGWQVEHYAVLNVKPNGVLPSDHFGVLADLTPE
ncbi:MAG: endonuclease/exonuclease/phosphatase family protein [Gemmataceae bacterium]|nr:endonuclease/exonuclease/phosphatase family protein [Gemmataceae bacterium]